jgi:hypothetical protein
MQLLKIILIIVIVYYVLKLSARYVLPLFLKYILQKSQERYKEHYQTPDRKKGEINVEYSPQKKPRSDDLGEYIDYEEIKEK